MLCDLAVYLPQEGGCMLCISGKTALGPSNTGGRDAKHYPTSDALLSDLEAFGLGRDLVSVAARVLRDPEARRRLVNFAEDVQIPFEMLERSEIHLFESDSA